MSILLTSHYDLFNRTYFRNKLPRLKVRWYKASRKREFTRKAWHRVAARTMYRYGANGWEPYGIWMHPHLRRFPGYCQMILLHECVHVSLGYRVEHGKKFQAGMKRLARIGAFRELW